MFPTIFVIGAFIVVVLALSVLLIAATRRNNADLALGEISAQVWRNRDRLAGTAYFAAIMILLLALALYGDARG